MTVTGDIDKTIITSIQAPQAVLEYFDIANDYFNAQLIVDGEAQETEKSMTDMAIISLIAVVGAGAFPKCRRLSNLT